MTGAIVTAVAAVVLTGTLYFALRHATGQPTLLERLLAAAALERAMARAADLEAVMDAISEPLDDEHADRALRLVKDGEAPVIAHCPDCSEELQDEAFEFWCPNCEAAVSYARVAAEGA